jgi:hypothetical protein
MCRYRRFERPYRLLLLQSSPYTALKLKLLYIIFDPYCSPSRFEGDPRFKLKHLDIAIKMAGLQNGASLG